MQNLFSSQQSFLRSTYQNWHSKTNFIFYEHVNDDELGKLFIKYHAFTFLAHIQIALLVESQTIYCQMLKNQFNQGQSCNSVRKLWTSRGILVYHLKQWQYKKTTFPVDRRLFLKRKHTDTQSEINKNKIKLQTRSRICGVDRNGQPTVFYKTCPSFEIINNVI